MFHAFKFQTNKILRYYLICLALYIFPKGTAHSFLLIGDGYLGNRDGGNLMTEVKVGSDRGGGCFTVVADPLQIYRLHETHLLKQKPQRIRFAASLLQNGLS